MASELIILSGWDKKSTLFINEMTGGGTLAIEATLLAKNVPAGYFRREFGFENWKNFDRYLWNDIILEAEKNIQPLCAEIIGLNINRLAVKIAHENVKEAGLRNDLKILNENFFTYLSPANSGTVFLNPPYAERLESNVNLIPFYKSIGDTLKKRYQGFNAWIISTNLKALKNVGLKPAKKIQLINGTFEANFHKFEIFKGSRGEFLMEKNNQKK